MISAPTQECATKIPADIVPDAILGTGTADLEDRLFMIQEEFRTFLTITNGYPSERIIETAVPYLWLDEHLSRYRFALPSVAGKTVLDMASGTGYGSSFLIQKGNAKAVLGADIDAASVRYAQTRYRTPGLRYTCADACTCWTDERFDLVTSFETFEHVPAPDKMLDAIVEMLLPDGTFFVSTPVRRSGSLKDKPGNPYHMREWNQHEFQTLLNQYFGKVEIYGQRWKPAAGFGSLRLPTRVTRLLMRLAGKSLGTIRRMEHDVYAMGEPSPFWIHPVPQVMVAVCRQPHRPTDPNVVRRFAYGES